MRTRGIGLVLIMLALAIASGCTTPTFNPQLSIEVDHLTAASVRLTAPFGWATYEWTFGDGSTTFGRVQEHAYEEPGEYSVSVKALDLDGQAAFAHRTITVYRDIYVFEDEQAEEDQPTTRIQPALDAAVDGDWVFIQGSHRENVTIDKAITVVGPCTLTSLTAAPAVRVRVDGVRLTGISFVGGMHEATAGGGIHIDAVDALIENCTFEDHSGSTGGAVYLMESTARFVGCTFTDNDADIDGGAVYCEGDEAFPAFEACTFIENRAEVGAGLAARATTLASLDATALRVESCVFTGNVASGALVGGAIHVGLSVRAILSDDNVFSGNGPIDVVFE